MDGVEAFIFDVFGTVLDWRTPIVKALKSHGEKAGVSDATDWEAFADEWRLAYFTMSRQIAEGADGPLSMDVMHRQILDTMLQSSEWVAVGKVWDEECRAQLTLAWHRLEAWPDCSEGLYALKEKKIIAALSNGNLRLLVDLAKYADLPWDAVFSTELFGTYKPNPKPYQSAAYHLSLQPNQCALVAAHLWDVRAAARNGMKTVYVRRPEADGVAAVNSKAEGGDVDLVVDSLAELGALVSASETSKQYEVRSP